ncbi:hypothetical protein PHALS_00898 [Plasmopara halstedii]|uniref:Uncharacterized protein n=1 Tax=Plasmopara halstedii TaxID=4781 RepID=A0A0P1ATM5_PLAHL|nr:hypothetical protein PHALS_00898 [Plasmopara halstedii]|eukprot:XP_024580911.1 hypothetical protein PHALS_00898 [Plasmopara halstedii]
MLPTPLIYILLSTKGYSPWRPDAILVRTRASSLSPSNPIPRKYMHVEKERELFPGLTPASSGLGCVTTYYHVSVYDFKTSSLSIHEDTYKTQGRTHVPNSRDLKRIFISLRIKSPMSNY